MKMNTEKPELITGAKIIAATLLAGVGAVGLYGSFNHTRVALGMLILGLWLLVGAWTGRSMWVRLQDLYVWYSKVGVDSSKAQTDCVRDANPANAAPSA